MVPGSEPMHVDTSSLSETEIWEMAFPKLHKPNGPEGLRSFLFKDDGQALTSETTELLRSISLSEEIPKN